MVDIELKFLYNSMKQLENELSRQETMQERVIVRQDIRATEKKINRLLQEKQNENQS
tara:strand:+ start:288 stop:458 length:171 start_codon:yes stop_codon:yes gene_type:complete